MSSFCLSLTENLRCLNFDTATYIGLAVPTFFEFAFTLVLAFRTKHANRDWLIVLEGWSYLLLTIMDLVAHITPTVNDNLTNFKTFDLLIAAGTAVPLLAFCFFGYTFVNANVLPFIRRGFRPIIMYIIVLLVPFLIILDEVGSFVGIAYRTGVTSTGRTILAVGFTSQSFQRIWLFLSDIALGTWVGLQAYFFLLIFFYLAKSYFEQRRAEAMGTERVVDCGLNGLVYLTAGIKLGAIESVVGFASPNLARALSRRLLRLASRALMALGAIHGTQPVDDASFFEAIEGSRRRGVGRLSRLLLGNRERKTSPTVIERKEKERLQDQRKRFVTVQYTGQTPPVLEMRFSDIDLPDPSHLIKQMKEKSSAAAPSSSSNKHANTSDDYSMIMSINTSEEQAAAATVASSRRTQISTTPAPAPPKPSASRFSLLGLGQIRRPPPLKLSPPRQNSNAVAVSAESDSTSVVREMLKAFPGTPSHTNIGLRRGYTLESMPEQSTIRSQTPYSTVRRAATTGTRTPLSGGDRSQTQTPASLSRNPSGVSISRTASGKRKPVPQLKDLYIEKSNADFPVPSSMAANASASTSNRNFVPPPLRRPPRRVVTTTDDTSDYIPPSPTSGKSSTLPDRGGHNRSRTDDSMGSRGGIVSPQTTVITTPEQMTTKSPAAAAYYASGSTTTSTSSAALEFQFMTAEVARSRRAAVTIPRRALAPAPVTITVETEDKDKHESTFSDDNRISIPWDRAGGEDEEGVGSGSGGGGGAAFGLGRLKAVATHSTPVPQEQVFARPSFEATRMDSASTSEEGEGRGGKVWGMARGGSDTTTSLRSSKVGYAR